MFSFEPLTDKENKTRSRSFAAIKEMKTGKIEEVLYFTNESRDDDFDSDQVEKDFDEKMSKFKKEELLDRKYRYQIVPASDIVTGFSRETIYCCGKNGSGKTYQINQYVQKYHTFFPDNKILYVSTKNIYKDPSLVDITALRKMLMVLKFQLLNK